MKPHEFYDPSAGDARKALAAARSAYDECKRCQAEYGDKLGRSVERSSVVQLRAAIALVVASLDGENRTGAAMAAVCVMQDLELRLRTAGN